jgi:heme-degrading monooxygenase HmoA
MATYARQTTFQGDASKLDALLNQFRGNVTDMRQLGGSKGTRFLANRQTGKVIVVSLWDSAEAAAAAEASLSQMRSRGAETFGAGTPSTEVYEVLVNEDF